MFCMKVCGTNTNYYQISLTLMSHLLTRAKKKHPLFVSQPEMLPGSHKAVHCTTKASTFLSSSTSSSLSLLRLALFSLCVTVSTMECPLFPQADSQVETMRQHFQEESLDYVCKLQEIQERKKFECVEPVSTQPSQVVGVSLSCYYEEMQSRLSVSLSILLTLCNSRLSDPSARFNLCLYCIVISDAGLLSDSLHLLSPRL